MTRPDTPGGVVIVLGAAVWPGGVASPTLRRRAEHGARVALASGAVRLILTGGTGRHAPSEAEVAAGVAEAAGVPAEIILREDRSTTTLENLAFARRLAGLSRSSRITLVTDAYHMPRARLTAAMLGLRTTGDAPRLPWARGRRRQLIRMYLREFLALPAYALRLLWWRWRLGKG